MTPESRKESDLDPGQTSGGDMSPEGFRKAGRAVIDHVAAYFEGLGDRPVLPPTRKGEVLASLPASAPEDPEPFSRILEDYRTLIEPHLTHWQHPRFHGYFAITGSGPGILGDTLAAAANVNAMLWHTSPAATELEVRVMDWLRQMLGLPAEFFGHITDTASISTLLAIAAARHAIAGLDMRQDGLRRAGKKGWPVLYASTQTHSSLDKAAILLGLGQKAVRKIPVDGEFRMRSDALGASIEDDLEGGLTPFCVVATAGTTSTTSIDPLPEIAALCRKHGLWLHVDAAYGGAAALVPELRPLLAGMEEADSVVMNPHKWLFVPMHLSAFYCRRPRALEEAFSLVPEYLRTPETVEGEAPQPDFMNYGIQLGRRFRALKLWIVLRYFGRKGLEERIRTHVRIAHTFADWVDECEWMERMAPVPLSVVCFRARPPGLAPGKETEARLDSLNERMLDEINRGGESFLSHTRLEGRFALRFVVSGLRTTTEDVRRTRELLLATARKLAREESR
jgi:aromatic-L-amino-acid decarboxylase